MSLLKLSYTNFKASFKNYLSLVVSLAFTILILFNFLNLMDSQVMKTLGEMNADKVKIIVQAISIVLCCFMFFFIWYATNVFLTARKKEIGIYIFMGLTHQKIGKLYMLETMMIGLMAMILGIGFGILLSQLFVMILMALSDIEIAISFQVSWQAVLWSSVIYFVIYLIFVLKGYINILKSSVLDMVTASRANEYVKQNRAVLFLKAVLGLFVLGLGYYFAIEEAGMEAFFNLLLAVVLVIVGIYLLFGGLLPFVYQMLVSKKTFLYKKQRTLWLNHTIFRMKKNYRTYAMVSILMLCSVTALATGFAMRDRYQTIQHFENIYTVQIFSQKDHLASEWAEMIEKDHEIRYQSQIPILELQNSDVQLSSPYQESEYAILPYSKLKQVALDTHQAFDLKQPRTHEIIKVSKQYVLSIITEDDLGDLTLFDQKYRITQKTVEPYLGYLQEQMNFYCVSDEEFERLKSQGSLCYVYNYKLENVSAMKSLIDDLTGHADCQGVVRLDSTNDSIEWLKVLYSVCVFMFMVFVFASGSIIFMKLYNDAFEEKERYMILRKLGVAQKTLKKSVACELLMIFIAPLVIMSLSSYFSVHSLANMMQTDLLLVNIISVVMIWVFFGLCYMFSIFVYMKNAGILTGRLNS